MPVVLHRSKENILIRHGGRHSNIINFNEGGGNSNKVDGLKGTSHYKLQSKTKYE